MAESIQCPQCQAHLQPIQGFVNWCSACEWNLEPGKEAMAGDIFEAAYQGLSRRLGKALHENLKVQNLSQIPAHGKSWYLAMGFSLLVLALYSSIWLGGFWLLLTGWGQILKMLGGLVLLGFGVFAWPFSKPASFPAAEIIPRASAPQLYALLDQLCDKLNAPRLAGVVLTAHYNANIQQFGIKRRNVLYLGLPLWETLTPEERLSALGHELAHLVNGDPARSLLPFLAFTILFQTGKAICPDSLVPAPLRHGRIVFVDDMAAISGARMLMIPVNLLLALIARGFWAAGHGLLGLLWAQSQRAEYRADLMGMQIAGLDPMLMTLEKLSADDLIKTIVREHVVRREAPAGLFESLRTRWQTLPESEKERRRRLILRENHRLDATHPATAYRIEMLRAQRAHIHQHQLPGRDWKALEAELDPQRSQIALALVDRSRSSMYSG